MSIIHARPRPNVTERVCRVCVSYSSAASKGLSHPSLLRMRTMMKTAGDKLAADLKNLKVGQRSPRIFLLKLLHTS